MMQRRRGAVFAFALICGAVMLTATTSSARTSAKPSWCGPKKITLGLTDGLGGNVLMLSGPKGNSQGIEENKGLHKILDPSHKYKFIGEQPFEVTKWDPALTQKVLSADIAKFPKIDVIVSDFGPSLVGALPEFNKSGRKIPALATSDGNVLGCFWKKEHASNPTFKLFTVSTQNDHARLAIDWAVALATGGKKPSTTHFPSRAFENSVTGKPNPVECQPNLPGDIYLSAQLSAPVQAKLVKE